MDEDTEDRYAAAKRRIIGALSGDGAKKAIIRGLGGSDVLEYDALDTIRDWDLHTLTPPAYPIELIQPTDALQGLYLTPRGAFCLSRTTLNAKKQDSIDHLVARSVPEDRARAEVMARDALVVTRQDDGRYIVAELGELCSVPAWQTGKDGILTRYEQYFSR